MGESKDVQRKPSRNEEVNGIDVNNNQRNVKLAVLGFGGVGKSALTVRFLTRRFITEYAPTLEASYHHQTTVDDETVQFHILDTAGQVNKESTLMWGDGFLLVYSIADRSSFDAVKQIKQTMEQVKMSTTPGVLVGNKSDLEHRREVSFEEGENLAYEFGYPFFELSAADQINTATQAFLGLYREIRKKKLTRKRSTNAHLKVVMNKMFQRKRDRIKTL